MGGDGGRVAQDVARGLVKLGHEVHVLAPHMNGLEKRGLDEGVHLTRISSFRRKAFVGDLLAMSGYLLTGFFAGLWLIFRVRPQVIHVHFAVPAGFLAWVLSRLTGIPYVLTSHLGDVPGGVPEKTDGWFRWAYPFTPRIWRDASVVTAISDFTRRLALSHYPVDIKVIQNGIEVNQNRAKPLVINKPPQIVFVGRFVPQKNPIIIPKILYKLRDLDWHCVMIGDGELWEATNQKIAALELQDRFSLPGWIPQENVLNILHQSDILFLPSQAEGIPLSGLQSLTSGLAIVASQVGGVSELVEDGQNGFLHIPNDAKSFIKSMRSLLSDPLLLLNARNASLDISRKFDLSHIVNDYEQALSNTLNGIRSDDY